MKLIYIPITIIAVLLAMVSVCVTMDSFVAHAATEKHRQDSPASAYEFVYDGCEYVGFSGQWGLTHKGNCTNTIHTSN
jgi:hypothetical protein